MDFLPDDIELLRKAFDATCDQILKSTENKSFYALFTNLASMLRKHSLLKDCFAELETKSLERKEQFEAEALTAVEDSWLKLWKYHKHSLKYRRQLVEIKRLVTAPKEIGSSPLYSRILSRMWEFRHFSPFCCFISESWRFFKHAQYELTQAITQFDHFYPLRNGYFSKKYMTSISSKNKNKHSHFHQKIFKPELIGTIPFKRSIESISSAFFCLKTYVLKKSWQSPD